MKTMQNRRGFSLIELLTVIAIIAILAAIIFPVMAAVKERAKRVQCMTNMQQLASALKMFQMDNRHYPETLVGYVQRDSSGNVIPLEQTRGDALYPEYLKSYRGIHCPLSPVTQTDTVTTITVGGVNYEYYSYDSYNLYTPLPSGGSVTLDELRYTLTWANQESDVLRYDPFPPAGNSPSLTKYDYKRQLKFKQPSDDTVVTWCSYHKRTGDTKSTVPVLFLDGHTDQMPVSIIEGTGSTSGCRWRTQPKK